MPGERRCPRCGAELALDTPELLCPRCVLAPFNADDPSSAEVIGASPLVETLDSNFDPPQPKTIASAGHHAPAGSGDIIAERYILRETRPKVD